MVSSPSPGTPARGRGQRRAGWSGRRARREPGRGWRRRRWEPDRSIVSTFCSLASLPRWSDLGWDRRRARAPSPSIPGGVGQPGQHREFGACRPARYGARPASVRMVAALPAPSARSADAAASAERFARPPRSPPRCRLLRGKKGSPKPISLAARRGELGGKRRRVNKRRGRGNDGHAWVRASHGAPPVGGEQRPGVATVAVRPPSAAGPSGNTPKRPVGHDNQAISQVLQPYLHRL